MSQEFVKPLKDAMQRTIDTLSKELLTVRTGRANASILDMIKVEYYGFPTPLNEVASISIPEPRLIVIKPYERETLKLIESAIIAAQIGMMPNNDGSVIRLNVPALTEERRKEFVKLVGKYAEGAKVAIRNIRRNAMESLKKDKAIPEDQRKRFEKEVQNVTDEFTAKIDQMAKNKEKEIMTI
ncbi:MAG: ribosome recycling factor [Bacilli bacterium]|nr:ribosome recycling factor [Bacilli bacterium]